MMVPALLKPAKLLKDVSAEGEPILLMIPVIECAGVGAILVNISICTDV